MQSLAERVKHLKQVHGGLRAASRAIGIDCGYLNRLESGDKTNPSDDTLDKLGLRKEIVYVLK